MQNGDSRTKNTPQEFAFDESAIVTREMLFRGEVGFLRLDFKLALFGFWLLDLVRTGSILLGAILPPYGSRFYRATVFNSSEQVCIGLWEQP